jgi:dihydropyrimidine dehydrogenase (NAD+) subunit PreA
MSGPPSPIGNGKPVDLTIDMAGIHSPNPFWLASGPPANTADQVMRAFDAGWGGAVWKTLGEPIVNVSSRLGGQDLDGVKLIGLNNIELITDRPLEINFREIAATKKRYPKHAVVVSLMVESKREAWHEVVKQSCDSGADGIELNFGCPHGMSERGMGAAVGQVPDYTCQITEWVKEVSTVPVIVKLTPNVSDIRYAARAAAKGGADGLSLINTINSIMGVDLDKLQVLPVVDGKSSHGGYCGPAVKPIALHMLSQITTDEATKDIPVSGIGGIATWKDALEFILLGATSLQVCTAVMHYGYRIVEDMTDGMINWMQDRGYGSLSEIRGMLKHQITDWGNLNLNYKVVARIDAERCIKCNLCHVACEDGAHQCIEPAVPGVRDVPLVDEDECVGCNLCALICPVNGCIHMTRVDEDATIETWTQRVERTGSTRAAWEASPIAQSRHGRVMGEE